MDRDAILAQPALQPPPGVTPNFENPPNMNTLSNGVVITALIITSLCILARIHSWVFILTSLKGRLEAILVIGGFASYIAYAICILHVTNVGFGLFVHQWDVTVGQTIPFSYWVYVGGLLYNSAIAPVKVAILIEWMRIFSPRNHDAFWWLCQITLWLNALYYTAATVVESMQCSPRAAIWDPTVKGTCLNTRAVELSSSSINVISDIVILIAPQFVIWRLQLSNAKKFGLALVFAVGLFGTISSIFRLVATQTYLKSDDSIYNIAPLGLWAVSEMTSVFLVYGMPAIPALSASASSQISHYYALLTKGTPRSSNKDRSDPNKPRSKYQNIDKGNHQLDSLDTKSFAKWDSARTELDGSTTQLADGVGRTIEINSHESRDDTHRDGNGDSGNGMPLHQHSWA
ncbi:hypothetical protein F5Y03DRAFT_363348 [Xylaria venustula]|nr:hypothetical protein F5Y03DRAFT_363348 [Xylaria venustula]